MADTTYPLDFVWTADKVMRPLNPHAADRQYVVGDHYRLDRVEERSEASHRHEFAWLTEAWRNLPEQLADLYPSPEHLRKRALIDCGFYDETVTDVGSNAAALRVMPRFRALDDFALVIVRGPVVVMRTAKSQSRRHMKAPEFRASKTAIMDLIASMIGVTPAELGTARAAA